MHDEGAIGAVVLLRKSHQQVYVRAALFEHNRAADAAWELIKSGECRSFSVGPKSFDRIEARVDGVLYVDRWTLREISICRTPANADCHFEIFRDI
jgi:HK97 family phage prohead protease